MKSSLRTTRHLFFVSLVAVASLAISACVPESKYPLPEETRVAVDQRLVGVWHGESLGTGYTARISKKNDAILDLLFTETNKVSGTGAPATRNTRFELHFFNVTGQRIVGVRGPGFDQKIGPVWRFARYRFGDKDGVAFYFMSDRAIYNYVNSSFYRGVIRNHDPAFHEILLMETPPRLAAIIRKRTLGALFSVTFGPFRRQ
ncbi:MAG: hypothetical protein ACKVJQ_04300 [Alphaproteobacteria bacterium]